MKSFIVVPVNIGWKKPGKDGKPGPNVMGRGVAAKAAERMGPVLPQLYGEFCAQHGAKTPVTFDLSSGLVLFPTKPLAENPAMSWKGKASLELIERSARQLAEMTWLNRKVVAKNTERVPPLEDDDVYVPLVGCGNGGLSVGDVVPILKEILVDDRFVLVQYQPF
jgi:hypothetical protein